MTTDLWMLIYSAVLCLTIPLVYVSGQLAAENGVKWGFGNRDTDLGFAPWVGRAKRAHLNLVENLAPFAALVLIAHTTGASNETTALGATVFFWGRVGHFAAYLFGIRYLRTAMFAVSIVGLFMILAQLW